MSVMEGVAVRVVVTPSVTLPPTPAENSVRHQGRRGQGRRRVGAAAGRGERLTVDDDALAVGVDDVLHMLLVVTMTAPYFRLCHKTSGNGSPGRTLGTPSTAWDTSRRGRVGRRTVPLDDLHRVRRSPCHYTGAALDIFHPVKHAGSLQEGDRETA